MNKPRLLIENFLVYGLGGIISKAIPIAMIPIITRIMPNTEYYGISDMSNTIVQFGSALAIMGMYDAMYRMFFEKSEEKYRKSVCSTALMFTLLSSLIVFIIMLIFRNTIALFFLSDPQYSYIVYLSALATLVGATNSIISAPTRMQNKRRVFLVTNTVSPLLSYGISIPLLLAGYYTVALPLAAVVSGITMEISFGVMNYKWFNPKKFEIDLLKQLLIIGLPLLPNFLIYWLFNSCDKVMITNLLGIGAAGVYSVGSKLGHVSQLIYTAFAGGWQYFAFATMKEEKQVESNSIIFEFLGVLSFVSTAFVCAWSYWIFEVLFKEDYSEGYIVAPYLFLAPLLQMLYQVIANQFLIIKKTWPSSFMLASGALVNIVLNLYLIPVMGIEGAALATLLGYIVTDVICSITLVKMKLMVVHFRFIITTIIICSFFMVWRFAFSTNIAMGTILALLTSIIMMSMYRTDIQKVVARMRNR